ncbi:MAG: hypothetical protein PHT69_07135 [Bacteroidales bacterium]|nr:hypothetical protein [Bacteroidales bacterium]
MPDKISDLLSLIKLRYCIYLFILAFAVYLRFFANSLQLYLEFDAPGYLLPALDYLSEGTIRSYDARAYPYPMFVLVVLKIFKSLSALTIIQHVIGICGGLFFVFLSEKIFSFFPANTKYVWVLTALNSIVLALMMLNGNIIVFEKTLRPEALLMPFLNLIFLMLFLLLQAKSKKIILATCLWLCFLSMLLFPRFLLSFAAINIIAVIVFFRNCKSKKVHGLIYLTATTIIMLSLVWVPEIMFRKKSDGIYKYFVYQQFFYSNAGAVLMALKNYETPAFEYVDLNNSLKNKLEEALSHENKTSFPVLSYDVDQLQYEVIGPLIENSMLSYMSIPSHIINDSSYILNRNDTILLRNALSDELQIFYKSWTFFLTKNYPWQLFQKTFNQFFYVLSHKQSNPWLFPSEINLSSGFIIKSHHLSSFRYLFSELNYRTNESLNIRFPEILVDIYCPFSYLFRWGTWLSIFVFLYLIIQKKDFLLSLAILIIYISAVLPVGMLHTFEHQRYSQSLLVLGLYVVYGVCVEVLRNGATYRAISETKKNEIKD